MQDLQPTLPYCGTRDESTLPEIGVSVEPSLNFLGPDKFKVPDDLYGVSSGPVPGSHVPVALGHGGVDGEVTVLAVHVVGT